MTRAAYHYSKRAEVVLVPFLLKLLEEHNIVPSREIKSVLVSSSLTASPWDVRVDHDNGTLLVDVKLAPKARIWGSVAPQTFEDIRKALEAQIFVLLFVHPKVYLLDPQLLPSLPGELTVAFLEASTPSTSVDEDIAEVLWDTYDLMVLS